MKVIHKDGFSKQEIERFTDILRDNCLVAMQVLILPSFKIQKKFLYIYWVEWVPFPRNLLKP